MFNCLKPRMVFVCVTVLRGDGKRALIRALTGVSISALFFMLLLSTEAKAQVATLEGEVFQSTAIGGKTSVTCDPGGKIVFHIEGVASGPSPGPFEENGAINFDPISGTIIDVEISFAVLTEDGKNATVKGVKRLLGEGKAQCSVDKETGVSISSATAQLLYEANIITAGNTDSGEATFDLQASSDGWGLLALEFIEVFHSSNHVKPTLGKVTGGGNILLSGNGSGMTFGFNAQNTENGMKGSGIVVDHSVGKKVKIIDVTFFAVNGTKAVFMGRAQVNGQEEKYQIDVDDLGEPGSGSDTFRISTDSYRAEGVLSGGNIQVHKGDTP